MRETSGFEFKPFSCRKMDVLQTGILEVGQNPGITTSA